ETYAALAGKVRVGAGGMVFYLGGHDYSGAGLALLNGRRMLMNAIMTPGNWPLACAVDIPLPDLAIQKFHTGVVATMDTVLYDFNVTNVGAAATVDTAFVSDTLPAGVNFLSGSGTGWTFSVS